MHTTGRKLSIHERVGTMLKGGMPDRPPFIGRLELWHTAHQRAGTLPPELAGLSLTDIHRHVGFGQQKFVHPFANRLRGATVSCTFSGEEIYRESDPVLSSFPDFSELVPGDRPGTAEILVYTPVGALSLHWELNEQMVRTGTRSYRTDHLIKEEADYQTVEYLLERAEWVPQFERCHTEQARMGDIGFVVPALLRIPFQQVLLEYLGEVPLFYALHDAPQRVERLLGLLDERATRMLHGLAGLDMPYVEWNDNIESGMANPRLFARYCLPAFQRYAEILHAQGKKMGSHTDGNVRPLLRLLKESGLDVCESFSPTPLTPCTLEEALEAWGNKPLIWGGVPSTYLDADVSDEEFLAYVEKLMATVAGRPIILCVVDLVMAINSIERIRYIAERVERG